jgi:SAM-dependent methyltransferase
MANADLAFTGSVPELYTRYMGPMLFEPFAEHIALRVETVAVGDVLETACGTGIVSRALRRRLPEQVKIMATDLNQAMLDHAKTLSKGQQIGWQQADAQALPFPDAAFDAVVCAFGAMFFPDKEKAYREAMRVLRPRGRFLFAVWDKLETMELQLIAHNTVAALYPQNPPDFFRRTPSGYHDIATIRADLAKAGIDNADIETVELTGQIASARDAAIGYVRGTPLSAEITARDPTGLDRAVEAVTEAITVSFGDGPIRARMQAHVITT